MKPCPKILTYHCSDPSVRHPWLAYGAREIVIGKKRDSRFYSGFFSRMEVCAHGQSEAEAILNWQKFWEGEQNRIAAQKLRNETIVKRMTKS